MIAEPTDSVSNAYVVSKDPDITVRPNHLTRYLWKE
jgi:hypothetical protein